MRTELAVRDALCGRARGTSLFSVFAPLNAQIGLADARIAFVAPANHPSRIHVSVVADC